MCPLLLSLPTISILLPVYLLSLIILGAIDRGTLFPGAIGWTGRNFIGIEEFDDRGAHVLR